VLTVPFEQMQEACRRIGEFCAQHYVAPPPPTIRSLKDTISYQGWKASLGSMQAITSESLISSMKQSIVIPTVPVPKYKA
jgi:hypothetical protein